MELIRDRDMPVGVVYHTGMKALFTTNLASREVPRPSEVVLDAQRSQDVEFWGGSNDFPQQVIADIENSDIVDTVIDWKARTMVGEGVAYGNLVPGPGGAAVLQPEAWENIDRWLNKTNFNLYCYEAALDFYTYYNANAELQRARSGDVIGCFSKDQSWRRYGVNDSRGQITKAYESACWGTATDLADTKKVITLEALDPYFDLVGQIQASKNYRHIIPIRVQTKGRKYYALAPWNGLRASGWLELAMAIPKMKLRLIKNMMQIRYHIEIADSYWPKRYGAEKWKNANDSEREKMINDEVKAFEQLMTGEEEIGKPKTLMTRMVEHPRAEAMLSLWKVTTLPFNIPTGAYIEDSQETDFHVLRALGVDPALVGVSPGKSSSSPGSGSADRVKRTNYLLGARLHGQLLLSMMPAISEINGWDKKYNGGKPIQFTFRSLHTASLDRTTQVSADQGENTTEKDGAV